MTITSDHKEAGFSLAETLMALVVISLTLGIVMQASNLVRRLQKQAQSVRAEAMLTDQETRRLSHALDQMGSVSVRTFQGGSARFQAKDSSFNYTAPQGWHLTYVTDQDQADHWPEIGVSSAPAPALRAIALKDQNQKVRATARVRVEEPQDCAYDLISRTCREPQS